MSLIKFGTNIIKFGNDYISIGDVPMGYKWSWSNEGFNDDPDYPDWYSYTDKTITLSEPSDVTPSHFPYMEMLLDKSVNVSGRKFNLTLSKTSKGPRMCMWLVDSDGNVSNFINIGTDAAQKSETLTSKVLYAFTTVDNSKYYSLNSKENVLSNADLSSFYGDFNPAKFIGIRICLAEWYRSSADWKSRDKSITISKMSFE